LSTVSSLHTTFCRLEGPPLSFNTPTGSDGPASFESGPVPRAGVAVCVSVLEPDSGCVVCAGGMLVCRVLDGFEEGTLGS